VIQIFTRGIFGALNPSRDDMQQRIRRQIEAENRRGIARVQVRANALSSDGHTQEASVR
jgi:hypothetical protein